MSRSTMCLKHTTCHYGPCQIEPAADPAQSAPSAEQLAADFAKEWIRPYQKGLQTYITRRIGVIADLMAAYAALRTAQLERELQGSWQVRDEYFKLSKKVQAELLTRAETAESALKNYEQS